MNLSDKISEFLKSTDLTYMKNETNTIYNLPYKIEKNNVVIHIEIDDQKNTMRMSFTEFLYNNSNEIKNEILKLNTRLVKGTMGIPDNKMDSLEFVLSFEVPEQEEFTKELYENNMFFCLRLYKNLIERKILKDNSNDE